MGSKAQPAGKTWWEQQRTGLSRLIAVLAFLVVALTESRWELHQDLVLVLHLGPQGRSAGERRDLLDQPQSPYVFSCIGLDQQFTPIPAFLPQSIST